MAITLPTRGQPDWDDELNNALNTLDADVQSAVADAEVAVSTANNALAAAQAAGDIGTATSAANASAAAAANSAASASASATDAADAQAAAEAARDENLAWGTSSLLSSCAYEPAANTTLTTSSTSFVDVSAANLVLPDFVAPDSGVVFVRLSALCYIDSAGNPITWNLRDGAGNIAGTSQIATRSVINSAARISWVRKIAVAPGATISGWKWGWRVEVGTRVATIAVGATDPAPGAALMEVYSTPL